MATRAEVVFRMRCGLGLLPVATGWREHRDGVTWLACARTIPASPRRAWQLITDPDEVSRWAGTCHSVADGQVGFTIAVDGDGAAAQTYELVDFDPPDRLEVRARGGRGEQVCRVVVELEPDGSGTRVLVRQSMPGPAFAPLVGAGLDYHLDRLLALESGTSRSVPDFDSYFVVQAGYYRRLFPIVAEPVSPQRAETGSV